MKKDQLVALNVCAAVCAVWGGPPTREAARPFPAYTQVVEATFADAGSAAAAECVLARLPDDADLAFCCRWDDTNPADFKKGEMMRRAGVKGSFYFVGNDTPYFTAGPGPLMAMGHSLGNHTMTHSHMLQVNPNLAFWSIAAGRIKLETAIQRTVNSYVSPYGWSSNPLDPGHGRLIAECIVATGHFVTQDDPMPRFGIDERCWMPTWRFSADDHDPSRELFVKGFGQMMPKAKSSATVPRLTLGTHAWCDDAGNARQEAWLREFCVRPEFVQLNDWEYGAYRYQAVHGRVRKLGTRDAVARFEVTRFAPNFVGDAIPLDLKFSVPAKCVVANGRTLASGARGTWKLPHSPDRRLPAAIASAGEDGSSSKFLGLKLVVVPDEVAATLTVKVVNRGAALKRVHVAAALPPMWSERLVVADRDEIAAGETVFTFAMGERPRSDYAFGTAYYPVSLDFDRGGETFRLWATKTTARVEMPELPARAALVWGPANAAALEGTDWAAVSVAGTALPDATNWKAVGGGKDALWNVVARPVSTRGKNAAALRALIRDPRQGRFVVYDFTVASAGEARLITTARAGYRQPFLCVNGEKMAFAGTGQKIKLRAGRNRVLLRADAAAGEWFTDTLYFGVVGMDGLTTLY